LFFAYTLKNKNFSSTDAAFVIAAAVVGVIDLQYEKYGENFVDMLDGVFAFVLYDTRDRTYVAARDAIGVNPLYIGWGSDGQTQTQRGVAFSQCGRAKQSTPARWVKLKLKLTDRFSRLAFPPLLQVPSGCRPR
jgi:asparagine synthetase B (glutamine-hydrolysing)